jgi:hypothetical protein
MALSGVTLENQNKKSGFQMVNRKCPKIFNGLHLSILKENFL